MTRSAATGAVEARRIPVGGDDMDTSETICGKRERAPAERVMDMDIPTHSLGRKCRLGDLHLALGADKDGVKEHAKLRRPEMEEKIDTQSRKDPGAPSVFD